MLVLSRLLGQKIFIGDGICITVVEVDRGRVRLGIDAPREVPVYREEMLPDTDPRSPHYRPGFGGTTPMPEGV